MDVILYKRPDSPYWWMRWYVGGRLYRESTSTRNKKKAQKILKHKEDELMRNMGIVDADTITMEDLIQKVIDDYKYNNKKSADKVEQRAEILYEFFGKEKSVVHILTKDVDDYVRYRFQEKKKPATINRELALLKRGFNLLRQNGFIGSIPYIRLLREDNARKGFFEHWEYIRLMDKASDHIKPLLTFLYYTGWRYNEALQLTWDMVDVDNGIITLPPGMTKNRKGRHYYMPDEIGGLIAGMWNDWRNAERADVKATNYVLAKKDYSDRIRDIRGAWRNSCERAGLKGKLIHDFRRTAARNYVRAGVPQRVAQELLGHQTASIFSRYNIVSDEDLREAVKKQSQYLNSQGKEKPASMPPKEWRDWGEIILPVPDDTEESEEKRPLQEILAEITEEYAKKKAKE